MSQAMTHLEVLVGKGAPGACGLVADLAHALGDIGGVVVLGLLSVHPSGLIHPQGSQREALLTDRLGFVHLRDLEELLVDITEGVHAGFELLVLGGQPEWGWRVQVRGDKNSK